MMRPAKISAWVQASRPAFFIATLIPLSVGYTLAIQHGIWQPFRFFCILTAAMMIHVATNLANDYYDHIQGADAGESIGGSRVIQEGKISLKELKRALILLYTISFSIGLYLIISLQLWEMIALIVFAFLSSIFYVAPPIRYGYHGLGELFVGINMGPVMVIGTFWAITGQLAWKPLYVSIPIGLMVAAILYYQSLPDMQTDRAVGKKTLAVRLGKRGAFIGLITLWCLIYASITCLVFARQLSIFALLFLTTLPIFFKLIILVKQTHNWVDLDRYGKYIRILYFLNGLAIIGALVA